MDFTCILFVFCFAFRQQVHYTTRLTEYSGSMASPTSSSLEVIMKTHLLSLCISLSSLHLIILSNSPITIALILLRRNLRYAEAK